jgi:hypothetical protein
MEIFIAPDGSVQAIYSDALVDVLDALGAVRVQRASHVEPDGHGGWAADMSPVGGPVLGPFRLRRDALAAEVAWLECKLEGV